VSKMTPEQARQIVGDEQARIIEAKAREDADATMYVSPSPLFGKAYQGQFMDSARMVVYRTQYTKRLWRNARKANSILQTSAY
jgi:hypothetical protein